MWALLQVGFFFVGWFYSFCKRARMCVCVCGRSELFVFIVIFQMNTLNWIEFITKNSHTTAKRQKRNIKCLFVYLCTHKRTHFRFIYLFVLRDYISLFFTFLYIYCEKKTGHFQLYEFYELQKWPKKIVNFS